jgi:hypothetical protein
MQGEEMMEARRGRDAAGGSMRKHDSAVGQIWPETPGKYLGAMYLK